MYMYTKRVSGHLRLGPYGTPAGSGIASWRQRSEARKPSLKEAQLCQRF